MTKVKRSVNPFTVKNKKSSLNEVIWESLTRKHKVNEELSIFISLRSYITTTVLKMSIL